MENVVEDKKTRAKGEIYQEIDRLDDMMHLMVNALHSLAEGLSPVLKSCAPTETSPAEVDKSPETETAKRIRQLRDVLEIMMHQTVDLDRRLSI